MFPVNVPAIVPAPVIVGAEIVGLVPNTAAPEPVSSVKAAARLALDGVPRNVAIPLPSEVIPVPPLATGRVPVTPVVSGKPVTFVITPDAGVPRAGVVSVGLVKVLLVRVCAFAVPTTSPSPDAIPCIACVPVPSL